LHFALHFVPLRKSLGYSLHPRIKSGAGPATRPSRHRLLRRCSLRDPAFAGGFRRNDGTTGDQLSLRSV